MIHSAIKDNWTRVQILHAVAFVLYSKTSDSDFRKRKLSRNGDIFPFDVLCNEIIDEESSVIGMIATWSVILLECLINHALAEKLDKDSAITAIDFPRRLTKSEGKQGKNHPELAIKFSILSGQADQNSELRSLATDLSNLRNSIVHDKPFDLFVHDDGRTEYSKYESRRQIESKPYYYEDLSGLYEKCDKLKQRIMDISAVDDIGLTEIDFTHLLENHNDKTHFSSIISVR